VALGGMFAVFYARARIVRSGDATATADNIRASTALLRAGFVSNLVATTCFLLTAMALYVLLRHVNHLVAAAMVTFVAVSVAITGASLANQYTALTIATNDDYARAFGRTGADALTLLHIKAQSDGAFVSAVFFGLWLLPLGYLVLRSGYFPKLLGVLLMVGCFAWLADAFTHFLAPGLDRSLGTLFSGIAGVAELSFVAWLLVKGARVEAAVTPEPAPALL
jgi:hypothetical protein